MMSKDIHKWTDGRYTLMFDEHTFFVFDNEKNERMTALNVTKKLNEQQATIEEYKDFCLNLCRFLIQKDLVDEYREKYGKEYKIITKWWNNE